MDLQIKRNNGIVKLELTLLDSEIENVVNSDEIVKTAFLNMWNGDIKEKYSALGLVMRRTELNGKVNYIENTVEVSKTAD